MMFVAITNTRHLFTMLSIGIALKGCMKLSLAVLVSIFEHFDYIAEPLEVSLSIE